MRPVLNKYNWAFPKEMRIWIFISALLLATGIVYAIMVKLIFGIIFIFVFAVPVFITGFLITKKLYKILDILTVIAIILFWLNALYKERGTKLIWGASIAAIFTFIGIYSITERRRKAKSQQPEVKSDK